MTPLIAAPWFDASGKPQSVRALPGLSPEVIRGLECSFPAIISPALKELLQTCSGLADTGIGGIDFTGCCFPEEPCDVFKPCLTLAIDDAGRRWIGEIGDKDLPGPIWCMFPDPKVAVYVSDDLATFIATLRVCAGRADTLKWLQDLSAQARTVWSRRHALARRPYELDESDEQIRRWLAGLPFDAYVYDLRTPTVARGWPYGLAGPTGRLYRCGRLPVFAVAGPAQRGGAKCSARPFPRLVRERSRALGLLASQHCVTVVSGTRGRPTPRGGRQPGSVASRYVWLPDGLICDTFGAAQL
jgi:hypothetical protein